MLREGDEAPDFELSADDGSRVRLSELRGRSVVLYFYPKDDTPGCTKQACELRDTLPLIERPNTVVLGVSPDSVDSHVRFKAKYGLNFALLSDPDRAVAKMYGVWNERSLYGRAFMGIERSTFIVGEDGLLQHVWRRVRSKGHASRVAHALAEP